MSPASSFGTPFAKLVSLRTREPNNLDAHRAALADVVSANHDAVTLTWDNWQLCSESDTLAATSPAVLDLLTRMAAHGVRELSFGAHADEAQVLATAWVLSRDPVLGDGGAQARSLLFTLGALDVRMVPVVAAATVETEVPIVTEVALADSPSHDVIQDAASRDDREHGNFLTARRTETVSAQSLIARLQASTTPGEIARALDSLAAFTELRRKRIGDVASILTALIAQASRFTDEESKRMFGFVLRRIAKASTFRALSGGLVSTPERRDEYVTILKYFGDAAADQVIEQLAHADASAERRILFDTLVQLQRGVPSLISLLGDGRWYVVRNAADLLGEMRAVEAEQALAWLVGHDDARVRRSATVALARLDTPGARAALREATKDASPDVRMTALLGLSYGDKRRVVTQIVRALPDEKDPATERTLMIVLAKLGTPEALEYLLNAAQPEKGFFKKKPTPTRVAAVSALADAADPTALAAIRASTKDREREVRDAAARALPPAKARAASVVPSVSPAWA
jgi:HEAT repeat protein